MAINSIGVDLVQISEMKRLIDISGDAFINRTFTRGEVQRSEEASNKAEYFATRFAAKEAVFKAIAHFTKEKTFDLRIIETLEEPDGYPFIRINDALHALLEEAGISALHLSLTHDGDYAMAFVAADRK
jgi:phosphopantetheine--protein transferase-like protein